MSAADHYPQEKAALHELFVELQKTDAGIDFTSIHCIDFGSVDVSKDGNFITIHAADLGYVLDGDDNRHYRGCYGSPTDFLFARYNQEKRALEVLSAFLAKHEIVSNVEADFHYLSKLQIPLEQQNIVEKCEKAKTLLAPERPEPSANEDHAPAHECG
ncbi:MAG: hypothetical protein SFW62_05795 [Alphaproteobacteria bacterium]|nr:hypothetical protein [Alphaproteobacteria bacterium]